MRHHASDGALALLFLLALASGARAAYSGLTEIVEIFVPGVMPAAPEAVQARESAGMPLFGFAAVAANYSPQVLFPAENHQPPPWLALRVAATRETESVSGQRPIIAICIDDLGEDLAGTDKAIALPKEVTLSFLPYAEATPFLAEEAERKGHQVLAHVPMEAIGHPDPGPMSLKVGGPDIAGRLSWNIARVPGLSGINNHEGSRFSTDAASLAPVMQVLAAQHLFYFDSRTIAGSDGVGTAHRFGVMSAGRDVFLDDKVDAAAIRSELAGLVDLAKGKGVAIAIGHPHDVTLNILEAWLAQDHGVRLVPVSEAIKRKTGHDTVAAAY